MSKLNIAVMEVHPIKDSQYRQLRAYPEFIVDRLIDAQDIRMCSFNPAEVIAEAIKRQIINDLFGDARHALQMAQHYLAFGIRSGVCEDKVMEWIEQALAQIRHLEESVSISFEGSNNLLYYKWDAEESKRQMNDLRKENIRLKLKIKLRHHRWHRANRRTTEKNER